MRLWYGLLLLTFAISVYAVSVPQRDLDIEQDNRKNDISVRPRGRGRGRGRGRVRSRDQGSDWGSGSPRTYGKHYSSSPHSDGQETKDNDGSDDESSSGNGSEKGGMGWDIPWGGAGSWDWGDGTTDSGGSSNSAEPEDSPSERLENNSLESENSISEWFGDSTPEPENKFTEWFKHYATIDWFGFLTSKSGMNSENFYSHTFNNVFAKHHNTQSEYTPSSAADHLELKDKLWVLEQLALTEELTTQNLSDWQPLATALAAAFVAEDAAMSYDPDRGLWIVCGFISLSNTFIVPNNVVARLCASASSIGLESPIRDPIFGEDYTQQSGPSERMISAQTRSSSTEKENELQGKGIAVKVIYIDLTNSADAEMASCIGETGHQACTPFCCASEYSDATFCGGSTTDTCL